MFELTGKTALVTGSSRGIGRAIAIDLAKCGADIYIHYVGNCESAINVQAEIIGLGRKCTIIQADLIQDDCAEKIFKGIEIGVDILVLNASIQYKKKWEDISVSDFNDQINCNLRASMLLMQKVVPYMKENKWGRIVTVGSVQEAKPHPDMLVYSASKAAQTIMMKSLAVQLAEYKITVNNVAPGVILTDRNAEVLSNEEYYKVVLSKIPVGFCGETADCVGLVQLLCTDMGRYITGQNIYIDGGMSVK